ncbi:MAG: type II CAAX endopeptidase family protein [bacterium]|nr:type II CAAX endopeptidase family protein [bacterium]
MKKNKLIFAALFTIIPFLLWVIANPALNVVLFCLSGVMAIFSRYWQSIKQINTLIEIIFLFFLLNFSLNRFGLENFFPMQNIITIALLYFFLFYFKKERRTELYIRIGDLRGTVIYAVGVSLISITALGVWFLNLSGNPYAQFLPRVNLPLLLLFGLGFAVINAFYEESLFRSILLSYFKRQFGITVAIALQALWFSLLHYQSGFPSGWMGILMTLFFGCVMGIFTHRSRGIFIAVVVHFLADLSIFILVMLRSNQIL